MARVSRDSAPEVVDYGPAEDRTGDFDRYTVNFTSIREDSDLAPLLKELPGDSCHCPHWGYMIACRTGANRSERGRTLPRQQT